MKKIVTTIVALIFRSSSHATEPPNEFNLLSRLIGTWEGDKGMDIAPAQKKTGLPTGAAASNPYFEKIVISDGPSVTNASDQNLVSVSYHQQVFRKSDSQMFHDQVGYFILNRKNNTIIDSFCIPRGVCATAEGRLKDNNSFSAYTRPFAENSFMRKNGKTHEFYIDMNLNPDGTLTYSQRTILTIYGKKFVHVDTGTLRRKAGM
ncbi:heme-binding beta-barrel domain-containing protein [Cupriavidus sp. UYPR2.512]|uniref:heme-binding beta-barrel domain-containing protein n=1 Tax=Cupriavidus sp. UYPR2.512 TaxID=1080187 RepID=UPI0009DAD543|nr:heme-binding beta-barrel domain-containing protein [Cupriavidus sp. UYPR2.512]UIF88206.1 FABP family protein [Cupriavidus necator]